MPKLVLEEQLEALTRNFVASLVEALRNASFADVAALSGAGTARPDREPRPARATRASASARTNPNATGDLFAGNERRSRQTATGRAEVAERLVATLGHAGEPLGVRALASELGVAPSVLAAPLRELRAAGKIRKHGDKRATTYSLA